MDTKEYYKMNKKKLLEKRRLYYKRNKDKILEKQREYRMKTKLKYKEYNSDKYNNSKKKKCIICNRPAINKYCSFDCFSIGTSGEKNINWTGGKKSYDKNWTNRFKKMIRNRDGNMCMICNRHRDELTKAMSVHHIDGDPQNTIEKNCISLCGRHHAIVEMNGDKKYTFWMPHFQKMLTKLYGYNYTKNNKNGE